MENDTRDNTDTAGQAQVLPKLLRMCQEINKMFGRYVGPIAAELSDEAFAAWIRTGRKTKPIDVMAYISLLSIHLPNAAQRLAFEDEARRSIRLTN